MIILDTNVVSELMRSVPSPVVLQSLSSYPANEVCSSTVTLAEILYGIELLPAGKRKNELLAGAERLFGVVLANRILSFDEPAAQRFSHIAADRRRRGKPISELDAQIAAIAHVHGATLATRNISDFEGCGIRLVNPWVD
ncbi:MAG TPA: type II toxin-antitoxin system VapC family toxin [Terriglobales bacterium]|nr:type II toxin-antitoxin system VapC family toxin [Terriglobales bacterium]